MARVEFDFSEIKKFELYFGELVRQFPELRAKVLGFVGHEGKSKLKKRLLSGQELNLTAYPYDAIGRRTINYSINRQRTHVSITSYPVNLFEKGRTLRDGTKEAGRYIITRKFKSLMLSDMQSILNDYDRRYLQKEIDNI